MFETKRDGGIAPMKSLIALLFFIHLLLPYAYAEEICDIVDGAVLIAQDDEDTFLGKFTNKYDTESIFNDYGTYGSKYSTKSIWNQYASFGSKYSTYSPHNPYTSTPPIIVKGGKIIGYLTANKSIDSSISPNLLKALCYE